jgi:hypothetical protein
MRTYIFFSPLFLTLYIIQEELSASVAHVGQGSRHWLNGKDMHVAVPKNGNIV